MLSNRPILLYLLSLSNQVKPPTFTEYCCFISKSLSVQTWATKEIWILRMLTFGQDEISVQINVKIQCRKNYSQAAFQSFSWGEFSWGLQMNQESSICSTVLNNKYLPTSPFFFPSSSPPSGITALWSTSHTC